RETIMKVKSAYYDLLKTLKTKEVQEQILKHKEERRRVTAELLKEGISKNEDILLADAETSDQRLALFKTENDINIRRRALNNLIYAGPDTQTEVADRLENKKLNAGLSESKDLAIRSRMDLASFNYELKSAQKEIDIAKSSFYPKSSITGSYTRQKETPLSYPDVWALMFNVKWDIFNWGKTRSDVNRAVAVSEKLKNEYDALIKNILLEVEDKWYRVKEAEARVEANKDRFIYAQEHHKNEGLKLSEGVIKQAEFLGAETDLVRSRNEYIISIYDLNIALAEFEFAISSDLDPFVQTEKIEALNTQVLNVGKNRRLSGEMNFDSDRPDGSGLIQISNEAKKAETLDQGATISEQKDPADGAAVRAEPVKEGRYIVQVASFRSNDLADDVLRNLKNDFPEALIIKAGNFNKVRITGISTREEGLHLINELENKFKVKPLLVRSN
ncbi:MAG: TolC family protein, partial [Nitrospirae bacterium]|nr:TolC family protein [Nitrospirota bacterium]